MDALLLILVVLALFAIFGGIAWSPLLWFLLLVVIIVAFFSYAGGGRYRRW